MSENEVEQSMTAAQDEVVPADADTPEHDITDPEPHGEDEA